MSKINYRTYLILIALISALSSCDLTRRLNQNEYLLDENYTLVLHDSMSVAHLDSAFQDSSRKYPEIKSEYLRKDSLTENFSKNVDAYEINEIIKQQPNRKIFGVKFHAWVHTWPDPEKVKEKAIEKHQKTDAKNEKRRIKDINKNIKRKSKGKEPKDYRAPKQYRSSVGEWLMYVVGEPLVVVDSAKVQQGTEQIETYMLKHGYFDAKVDYRISYSKKKNKGSVYYFIKEKEPYYVNCVNYFILDNSLDKTISYALQEDSILKVGQVFDFDLLTKQRNYIEQYLRNRGYYNFSKDYIYYDVDSTVGNHRVDVKMGIEKAIQNYGVKEAIRVNHKIYQIGEVHVFTDYVLSKQNIDDYSDTSFYDMNMYYQDYMRVRPYVLSQRIHIKKGYKYRDKEVEATYNQLADLGIFRSVQIQFKEVATNDEGGLIDCYIYLSRQKRQSFALEADGTNNGGNLGINGEINYTNKNIFRGAENLKLSLAGGLEVQQLLTNQNEGVLNQEGFNPLTSFNTIEFGPRIRMNIPKLPFIDQIVAKNWAHTATSFGASLNFQQRPDFTRNIEEANIGFEAQVTNEFFTRVTFGFSALDIKNESQEFLDLLVELNDPVLTASFRDHIIANGILHFVYRPNRKSFFNRLESYYALNFESAGGALRFLMKQFDNDYQSGKTYNILGIQFAHYFKISPELRWYFTMNDKSSLAYRFYGGYGSPQANTPQALPFEKAYFIGGSNSVRAWRARTLGPGTYLDESFSRRFDKIGDFQLEANFEYRFDLFDFIEGALFADGGNIWLSHTQSTRPGGKFNTSFYKALALGTGVGLRIDLDFFLVRFDLAMQTHDPSLPEGEKWVFSDKTETNTLRNDAGLDDYSPVFNLNFGIGYPF